MTRPGLSHSLVFARASVNGPKTDVLQYLLDSFAEQPVSIYYLPDLNLFDFAVVGTLSEGLVDAKIVQAKHPVNDTNNDRSRPLFDRIEGFYGERYVCYGTTLDHTESDARIARALAQVEAAKPWIANSDRLFGMLLVDAGDIGNNEGRATLRNNLEEALKVSEFEASYCLSQIGPMEDLHRPPPYRYNISEFSVAPLTQCTCWVRFYMEIGANTSHQDLLIKLDEFHHNFKRETECQITTVCFPVLPKKTAWEVASDSDLEKECRKDLAERFPRDTAPVMWFGFKRDSSPESIPPDVKLPLGNFLISAKGRIGKTNAALAIIDAFSHWRSDERGRLQDSPEIAQFDVIYINLKSERGASAEFDGPDQKNEAQILQAVMRRKGIETEYVRPHHIKKYLRVRGERKDRNAAFIYTETSEDTSWFETIRDVSGLYARGERGLLLVIDEAFKVISGSLRADLYELYGSLFNTWGGLGMRVAFIGQEIRAIHADHPELDWIFGKSTLVIGGQDRHDDMQRVLLAHCDRKGRARAEALDSVDPQAMNEVVTLEEKPYKVGPVIVRPSLFGEKNFHPFPCHVRPEHLLEEEWKALETKWWIPES